MMTWLSHSKKRKCAWQMPSRHFFAGPTSRGYLGSCPWDTSGGIVLLEQDCSSQGKRVRTSTR
eukprot:1158238-Pelagomonas_calceolata.AAC.2